MKLAPHLHRLGNDIVASYLIDLPEGIALVDAGLPGHWNDLRDELEAIGRPLSDIRGLVLTHGDSDHIGFAERLRQEAGVPVFIHSADAHRVRTGEKPKTPMGPARFGPMLGFFAYGLRKNAMRTRYVQDVTEVADGDVSRSARCTGDHRNARALSRQHRRAHSAVDAVFVGDALTTRHVLTGREGAQPAPFTDEPAESAGIPRSNGRAAGILGPARSWHAVQGNTVRSGGRSARSLMRRGRAPLTLASRTRRRPISPLSPRVTPVLSSRCATRRAIQANSTALPPAIGYIARRTPSWAATSSSRCAGNA